MRVALTNAIRAYRRNPLDHDARQDLLDVFLDAGAREATAEKLVAVIDETLDESGLTYDDIARGTEEDYKAYFGPILAYAQDLIRKEREAEIAEAEVEPATAYDKPFVYPGALNTVQDAHRALLQFVSVLSDEGPVKGSGGQPSEPEWAKAKPEKSAQVKRARGARGDASGAPPVSGSVDLETMSDADLVALYKSLPKGPGRPPTSRDGLIQKIMELRARAGIVPNPRGRGGVRSNPYLSGVKIVRGYRKNPYLPDDQDPLVIYRMRAEFPGKFPLTPVDHYRAARLLLAHTQGRQDPPDFDRDEIRKIVSLLEPKAKEYARGLQSQAGTKAGEIEVPALSAPLTPSDYEIIQPAAGLVRYVEKGSVLGLLTWVWRNGTFDVTFPFYPEGTLTGVDWGSRVLFAPPEARRKDDLIDVYGLVQSLKDRGYRIDLIRRIRGVDTTFGFSAEVSAVWDIAQSLSRAGEILPNDSIQAFGQRLRTAALGWSLINPDLIDGKPVSGSMNEAEAKALLDFMGTILPERDSETEAFLIELEDNILDVIKGTARPLIRDNIVGAARILAEVKGKPGLVLGLPDPDPTTDHPIEYSFDPRPGQVVVRLPPNCLPFQLDFRGNSEDSFKWTVGIKLDFAAGNAQSYPHPMRDAVDWKNGFYNADDGRIGPLFPALYRRRGQNEEAGEGGQRGKIQSTPGDKFSVNRLSYRIQGQGTKLPESVAVADGYSVAPVALSSLFRGLMVHGPAIVRDSTLVFSPNFSVLRDRIASYNPKRPKVMRSGNDYMFLPFVVAGYRTQLGVGLNTRDVEGTGSADLLLALSEGSPTAPRRGAEAGVPVGLGRIDESSATSQHTGRSVRIPGLSAAHKAEIRLLRPPPSFRYVETVREGNKTRKIARKPYPYQEVGIAFLHAAGCRAMIGDEMGLGKTIQALGALALDPSPSTGLPMLPALILAPKSVLGSWENEVRRWLPHLSIGEGPKADVTIISWGSVARNWEKYAGKYSTLIVDEAHYGKRLYKEEKVEARPTLSQMLQPNRVKVQGPRPKDEKGLPYTGRTYGMIGLAHSTPHVFLLSGTLMENGGKDAGNLWTYLYALDPERFPDRKAFYNQYFSSGGKITKEKLEPFRQLFNSYHIRRMKSTVADQIGLGCLYSPVYGESDPGCPSTAQPFTDVLITPGGVQSEEAPVVRNTRRFRRNSDDDGLRVQMKSAGYLATGKVKDIEQAFVDLTPIQQSAYQVVLDSMLGEIVRSHRERYIRQAGDLAVKGGQLDYTVLRNAIEAANTMLLEENFAKLASNVGVVMTKIRQQLAEIKIPNAIDWIVTQLNEGEPCIVWVEFQKTMDAIVSGIEKANLTSGRKIKFASISGQTPKDSRTQIVRKFQEGEIDLIVASKAMREGVTLTRANRALFVEQWWVGAWMSQAEDRIYRIGQTRDCTIYYLLVPNTLDTQIWNTITAKKETQSLIFGSEEFREGKSINDGGAARDTLLEIDDAGLKGLIEGDDASDGEDEGEEEDADKGGGVGKEGLDLIKAVTLATIKSILDNAKARQILAETGLITISEDEVLEYIEQRGYSAKVYFLTEKGKGWVSGYTIRKNYNETMKVLNSIGYSVTDTTQTALAIALDLQQKRKPVNHMNVRAYEGGAEAFNELKRMSDFKSLKVASVLNHNPGDPPLDLAAERTLCVLQEITNGSTAVTKFVGDIQKAVDYSYEAEGINTSFSIGQVNNILKTLIQKGLIKSVDQGKIKSNSSAPLTLKLKANSAKAVRKGQNLDERVLRSRALMAGIDYCAAPEDPVNLAHRMAADKLLTAVDEAETNGVKLPASLQRIVRNVR